MPVISAHEVKKVFVERVLFDNVSFEINEKDRVGLVGVNGCGKTTLFRMLAGQEAPDGGGFYRSRGARIMTMEQTVVDTDCTVYVQTLRAFQPLIDAEAELEAMNAQLGEASGRTLDQLILRQHELRERFAFEGGLTYKSRTRATLLGLGFTEEELGKPLFQMSGGQRNKAQLASVLLSGADLLLLDEPTNHLDLDAVAWLEEFLKGYPGAFIVVSHDRYFLDHVTGRTMEILNGRLYASEGNYSRHAELMADEQEFLRRKYARTQKEIARIERIVEQQRRWGQERNFITAASKQKQADRLRATLVAPERETAAIRFHFHARAVSGNDVAVARRIAKSYGGRKVFSDTSLLIKRGERAFLLGPNGCGKTTLLRILLKKERPDCGEAYLGANVQPGYYEQNLAVSHPEFTPVEEVRELYPQMSDTDIRRALGAFLFRGDDVFKKMGALSGGEKARVQLLKLMLSGANFLVLDEPTNHLDIASREALEAALEDYEGTMLIVTHDRYLVERLADRVLEMGEDGIEEYLGGYEDYLEQKAERRAQSDAPREPNRSAPAEDYRAKKERQSALNRAAGEARRAEERVAKCEAELRRMEEKLAEPSVASDYVKAGELSAAMEIQRAELDKLYRAWEEAQKTLEGLNVGV
ncbi:MAG TPA: ABC-F family ATP-binding cassette domain-containing protein [Clostridia bacterium]|nr:ABC-F family ATP-binding cassette domain-containing protein [Clostridia bacterium]